MKCKRCGHRTNSLNAMRIHYLKKHPSAMKRRAKKSCTKSRGKAFKVCPKCSKAIMAVIAALR